MNKVYNRVSSYFIRGFQLIIKLHREKKFSYLKMCIVTI